MRIHPIGFKEWLQKMYFNSQHNRSNVQKIRRLYSRLESIGNELSAALRQLDDQTLPTIEHDIVRCRAMLRHISDEMMAMSSCLQRITDTYEATEAEIVRDIKSLPAESLFHDAHRATKSVYKTISSIPPATGKNESLSSVQAVYALYSRWQKPDAVLLCKYFPVILSTVSEIPEEWLQRAIYCWMARKLVSRETPGQSVDPAIQDTLQKKGTNDHESL